MRNFSLLILAITMNVYACNTNINLLKSNAHMVNRENFLDTISVQFHNNRIIVPVEIAGKTRQFLFDTGSPSIILEDLAQELNYPEKKPQINMRLIDEKTKKYSMSQIKEISFGNNLKFNNIWVIEDHKTIDTGLPFKIIDGVIGSDLMNNLTIKLDMQNKRIIISDNNLLSTTDEALKQPMKLKYTGHPYIEIMVQGKKKSVLFDTGSPRMGMLVNFKQYSDIAEDKVTSKYDGKGKLLEKEVRFNEIIINNIFVKNPPITTFSKTKKTPLIGTDILHFATVILDYKNNLFCLIPYNNSHEIIFRPGLGFSFDYKNNNMITHILKGSIAEKSGLEVGFQIKQIDNIITNTDSFCELYKKLDMNGISKKDTVKILVLDKDKKEREFILKQ